MRFMQKHRFAESKLLIFAIAADGKNARHRAASWLAIRLMVIGSFYCLR
jgi:hypothetical protein